MTEGVCEHKLGNGMVLLGEQMDGVESVAFGFSLPCGASRLRQGLCGAANVIEDWIFRGAGARDSRELGDALDGLGLHRSASVGSSHLGIGAALESSNLSEALGLYGDVVLRPGLADGEFGPARQLVIDDVRGLDDDPQYKVMVKLREQFYPAPLGRSAVGKISELEPLTAEQVREIVSERFNVSETIFSVAGKFDFDAVVKQMESMFGAEQSRASEGIEIGERAGRYRHIQSEGAQVHIALMTGTVRPGDEDYYNARVAVSVLAGGMSARLFTEVREKRGLCYAIGARYHGLKEAAGICCYAGTTPAKAQETADVIIGEFRRLGEGISEEEIQRAKAGLKSALVMHSESTSNRAGAIASDYYLLVRVRSLDEIKQRIEATSMDSVVGFLESNKFDDFTAVTIGPRGIEV